MFGGGGGGGNWFEGAWLRFAGPFLGTRRLKGLVGFLLLGFFGGGGFNLSQSTFHHKRLVKERV